MTAPIKQINSGDKMNNKEGIKTGKELIKKSKKTLDQMFERTSRLAELSCNILVYLTKTYPNIQELNEWKKEYESISKIK